MAYVLSVCHLGMIGGLKKHASASMFVHRVPGRRPLFMSASLLIIASTIYFVYRLRAPLDKPSVSTAVESLSTFPSAESFAQSPKRQCPVTKVSMLYGAHRFAELESALDSHRKHCERWGCEFKSLDRDLTSRKLYSKHYFLLSTMLQELSKPIEAQAEWVMWVDADSIVITPAISPCTFLPPATLNNVFALVTADHQGLNNGLFYFRIGSSSISLLTQIIDYPLAHPDEDLGWFGEQAAMARVISAIERQSQSAREPPGIAWVPREWFNAYQFEHGFEGERGQFVVHFAGLGATRLSHMAAWLEELERNRVEWEIPLERTFYKADVSRFWEEFAVNGTRG